MKNPKKKKSRTSTGKVILASKPAHPYRLTGTRSGRTKLSKPFTPYVWANPGVGIVQIFLADVPYYGEWIKGEGADMALYRSMEDDRVVGACLPLRNFTGKLKSMKVPSMKRLMKAADESSARVSKLNQHERQALLQDAKASISRVPPWRKPVCPVQIQAFREFMARHGADVAVLVTWTHETSGYQFVTVGADQLYSNAAVQLRDIFVKALDVNPDLDLGHKASDLRGDHPNVRLTFEQLDFLLWTLGRAYIEVDKLGEGHQTYVKKYHDQILPIFADAKELLAKAPPA